MADRQPTQLLMTCSPVHALTGPAGRSPAESSGLRTSLLGITPELRFEIYRQLFHDYLKGDFMTIFEIHRIALNTHPYTDKRTTKDKNLGILRVCKSIYEESVDILFC